SPGRAIPSRGRGETAAAASRAADGESAGAPGSDPHPAGGTLAGRRQSNSGAGGSDQPEHALRRAAAAGVPATPLRVALIPYAVFLAAALAGRLALPGGSGSYGAYLKGLQPAAIAR